MCIIIILVTDPDKSTYCSFKYKIENKIQIVHVHLFHFVRVLFILIGSINLPYILLHAENSLLVKYHFNHFCFLCAFRRWTMFYLSFFLISSCFSRHTCLEISFFTTHVLFPQPRRRVVTEAVGRSPGGVPCRRFTTATRWVLLPRTLLTDEHLYDFHTMY